VLINPVAVEKLASEKSAKIKTRQEAPQTIFSSRLDIFYLPILAYFEAGFMAQSCEAPSQRRRTNP
jgi:hypothetical protein